MRIIPLETWPRRKHFELFRGFDYPHFNLCAPVDTTRFHAALKTGGGSFTIALVYLLAKVANAIPEFRLRIRGEAVVEHTVVHPAPTALAHGDLFSYYTVPYEEDYPAFARRAADAIARAQENPTLEDEPGRDDLLFLTAIPWVAFTGLVHPIHMHPVDSTPRLSWGKYSLEGGCWKLPLSVQVHHALMDGVHVGRYFERVQAELDESGWLATPGK